MKRIVCFGDSLTACGNEDGRYSDILADRFPEHCFINRGSGGEGFEEALIRLEDDVISADPDIVIVEFGANDWWRDERPPEAWAEDLETIVKRLRDKAVEVIIGGVFGPCLTPAGERAEKSYGIDDRARIFRTLEERIARRHACGYVPNIQERIIGRRCCWLDSNHPNEYGNRHVADVLEPILSELLACRGVEIRRPNILTTRDMWDEAVALQPESPAAVCGETRLSFRQADILAGSLAAGMQARSGQERPTVAVFLPNCLEYFLVYWATVKIGGTIVPLNTWLRKDSLAAILERVAPDILVVEGGRNHELLECIGEDTEITVLSVNGDDGMCSVAELLAAEGSPAKPRLQGSDISIIMHTSGTTAAPKGAVMRNSDLVFNVMTTINAQQFVPSDVHLLVNPMFHCTALYSSLPSAAYQKSPLVITAETTPDKLMALVERERISTFLTVPSVLQRIVALPDLDRYDHSSLRVIGYAGSFMPVKTVKSLQKCFPDAELHNFFGLTETISATHVLNGDETGDRPDSIGRLLPFVEAVILDKEGGIAGPDETGELLFARENIISEYWNQPGRLEKSLTVIEGREWFRTGDLASMDEEGYFFIKGRKKDMIIVGGENVFSAEVEAVLSNHPGVSEAAVKGIPATGIRESLGEMIKAYVVAEDPSLDEREVRRHCHKALPSYKIPHIISFMDALPRNPAGKIVKTELM